MNDLLELAFCEALALDRETVEWSQVRYREIPTWDSVAHMQLIAEIEESLDVMLTTDDVVALSSFAKAKEILVGYGITFD